MHCGKYPPMNTLCSWEATATPNHRRFAGHLALQLTQARYQCWRGLGASKQTPPLSRWGTDALPAKLPRDCGAHHMPVSKGYLLIRFPSPSREVCGLLTVVETQEFHSDELVLGKALQSKTVRRLGLQEEKLLSPLPTACLSS